MKKIALHWQIIIAIVLAVIVGLLFNNPESRWRKVVLPTPDAPNINRFSFDVFMSGKLNSESSSYLNLKFFVSNILSKLRFIMI